MMMNFLVGIGVVSRTALREGQAAAGKKIFDNIRFMYSRFPQYRTPSFPVRQGLTGN